MWPTTAEVRDPWTPSIRLSAPAMASDTHKTSAREWKHATGKCINVRETLEPYKIICRHFVQHLKCMRYKRVCMQVNTHQCRCACEYEVINVSRVRTLPSRGLVCVQTELSVTHTLSSYSNAHFSCAPTAVSHMHIPAPCSDTPQAVFARRPAHPYVPLCPHTHVTNMCAAEAQLTAWQSL